MYEEEVIAILKKHVSLDNIPLETPKDTKLGDYAFPCFLLAKELKKSPVQIAQDLAQQIKPTGNVQSVVATGPYLNFFVKKQNVAQALLKEIFTKKADFAKDNTKKEKVMVEYSQANTHKAFHVGHVRGTATGEALARILHYNGHQVIRANYQGDTGAHVAKWLWCYLNFHKDDSFDEHTKAQWIASIYVDAVKRLKENEDLSKQAEEINQKLDAKEDAQLQKLWTKTRQWSLDEFEKIYQDLGTKFDHYFFESQVEEAARDIVDRMVAKGTAEISDGAAIINLEQYGLGVFVLLRSDRTTLYSSKDLALAEVKFTKYKIEKSIYVVGAAQSHHFRQVFKTLDLIGFKQAENCHHVAYAEVRLPTGKMSSRTGDNILYDDMKEMVFNYTRKETLKRHPDWDKEEVEKVVKAIAIGAIKFDMLNKDNNKTIVFDVKKACDFEGETGPYLQYTNARINSIIKKFKEEGKSLSTDVKYDLLNEKEQELVMMLSKFKDAVDQCSQGLKTVVLCRYVLDLAQLYNEYYHANPVLKADEETKQLRALLTYCVGVTLTKGLHLLGIEAPEQM